VTAIAGWFGLFAPKATPDKVVERIAAATGVAMSDPALQENYRSQGMEPDTNFLVQPNFSDWSKTSWRVWLRSSSQLD